MERGQSFNVSENVDPTPSEDLTPVLPLSLKQQNPLYKSQQMKKPN
jgi:hypothetical protein